MGIETVEHVVVFMIENRSFDSILGWLYEDHEPGQNLPPVRPGERRFDGLQGLDLAAFTNTAGGMSVSPRRGAQGLTVPSIDPGESFDHVNVQLFGKHPVGPDDVPTMTGYLADYLDVLGDFTDYDRSVFGPMILDTFTPAQLPVLCGLAAHYAVCDRWFCSVPSQTNPNRAFSLCGTSLGLVDNGHLEVDPRRKAVEGLLKRRLGDDSFAAPTVFNALHEHGFTGPDDWRIFWQSSQLPEKIGRHAEFLSALLGEDGARYLQELADGTVESTYLYRLFPRLAGLPGAKDHFAPIAEFHRLARAGKLPRFSFIEPRWTIRETAVAESLTELVEQGFTQTGNDYRPPGNVAVGEEFLASLYESLIADEAAWEKTLLVITSDEAVGQFDHVPPPPATPPWGERIPEVGRDVTLAPQYGFNFDRHGTRVPAILVSPYIHKGTVFRAADGQQPFDHTSIIASVLGWFGLGDRVADFGERTRGAPTFGHVLTLEEPRKDAREVPFLQLRRQPGDPLRFFDRLHLVAEDGRAVGPAEFRRKLSPGSAPFPRLGEPVPLHFEKAGDRANVAAITSGDAVKIVTSDLEVGAHNILGNWLDAETLYYDEEYLSGHDDVAQQWILRRADGAGPLRFGDWVTLTSRRLGGHLVTEGDHLSAHLFKEGRFRVSPIG